jgi:hypothetical protein
MYATFLTPLGSHYRLPFKEIAQVVGVQVIVLLLARGGTPHNRKQTYEEHHGQTIAAWMLATAGVLGAEGTLATADIQ